MPRLPDATDLGARPVPRSNRAIATVRNAGAVGNAVEGIGGALGHAADVVQRVQIIQGEAEAKELDNEFTAASREMLYTGEGAYFTLQGKDAVTQRKVVEDRLRRLAEEHVGRARSGIARNSLQDVLNRRINGSLTDIGQYSVRHAEVWADQQSEGRISQAEQDAILFHGDPVKSAVMWNTIQSEILSKADRKGWDAEFTQSELRKARGKLDGAVVKSLLNSDVGRAADYLSSHRDTIDWDDQIQLDAVIKGPMERRAAAKRVDLLMGLPDDTPDPEPGKEGGTASPDQMFEQGIIPIEGGTDRAGRFLTSPKGAIGPAQVMPGTAPEAAKLAGLKFDEKRYKTDYAYNVALGKAYFQKQLRDFGDPVMAAAAYNAGPGSETKETGVRGAVAKARAAGRPEAWRDYLPAETRKYVVDFQKRVGTVASNPTRHDMGDLYQRADVVGAREGWTFEETEAVKAEIDRRVARDERVLSHQEAVAYDDATRTMVALGDNFKDIRQLGDAWFRLSPQQQMTVKNVAEANSKPKPVETDMSVWWGLKQMEATNPALFARLDPFQYAGKLSQDDMKGMIRSQAEILGKAAKPPEAVARSRMFSIAKDSMIAAGIEMGEDPKGRKDAARRVQFLNGMEQFARSWVIENPGKTPDDMTIRKWATTWLTEHDGKLMFEQRWSDMEKTIPPRDRALLEQSLRQNGMAVTPENLARVYLRSIRDQGR